MRRLSNHRAPKEDYPRCRRTSLGLLFLPHVLRLAIADQRSMGVIMPPLVPVVA